MSTSDDVNRLPFTFPKPNLIDNSSESPIKSDTKVYTDESEIKQESEQASEKDAE